MFTSNGKYYLYRHVREDLNVPFYIGIGTKNVYDLKSGGHQRAYKTKDRSKFWDNIVAKTKYSVEILFETDDYEFLIHKEKEFIALYGRRDSGTGTLVNLTDGGETNNRGKPVNVYDLDRNLLGSFKSVADASDHFGINRVRAIRVILNEIYVLPRKKLIICPEEVDVNTIEIKEVYNFRQRERDRLQFDV